MSKDIIVHKIPPSSRQDTKPTDTKTLMHMRKNMYCDNDTRKNVEPTRCGYIWHSEEKNILYSKHI